MKQENLTKLFEGKENCIELDVAKCQCVEEILKIIIKVSLVYLLFLVMNWVGEYLTRHEVLQQGGFNSDVLFSVFVLPLLYSLKDIKDCFASLFIRIWQDEISITVKRGYLWNKYDKLYLKDLNNIEMYQTPGGKIVGYCSLDLYAFGGAVFLPYLLYTKKNREAVGKLMKLARQNQATIETEK